MKTCTHTICRCARAEELSVMADESEVRNDIEGSKRYGAMAVAAHYEKVPCRMTNNDPA